MRPGPKTFKYENIVPLLLRNKASVVKPVNNTRASNPRTGHDHHLRRPNAPH